jgi:hypothetical protein
MRKNNNKEHDKTISSLSQTEAILISIVRRRTIELKTTLHSTPFALITNLGHSHLNRPPADDRDENNTPFHSHPNHPPAYD